MILYQSYQKFSHTFQLLDFYTGDMISFDIKYFLLKTLKKEKMKKRKKDTTYVEGRKKANGYLF